MNCPLWLMFFYRFKLSIPMHQIMPPAETEKPSAGWAIVPRTIEMMEWVNWRTVIAYSLVCENRVWENSHVFHHLKVIFTMISVGLKNHGCHNLNYATENRAIWKTEWLISIPIKTFLCKPVSSFTTERRCIKCGEKAFWGGPDLCACKKAIFQKFVKPFEDFDICVNINPPSL